MRPRPVGRQRVRLTTRLRCDLHRGLLRAQRLRRRGRRSTARLPGPRALNVPVGRARDSEHQGSYQGARARPIDGSGASQSERKEMCSTPTARLLRVRMRTATRTERAPRRCPIPTRDNAELPRPEPPARWRCLTVRASLAGRLRGVLRRCATTAWSSPRRAPPRRWSRCGGADHDCSGGADDRRSIIGSAVGGGQVIG